MTEHHGGENRLSRDEGCDRASWRRMSSCINPHIKVEHMMRTKNSA